MMKTRQTKTPPSSPRGRLNIGLTFQILYDPSGKITRRLRDHRCTRDLRDRARRRHSEEGDRRVRLGQPVESRADRPTARGARKVAWSQRRHRESSPTSIRLKSLVTENLPVKFSALFFAVVLWVIVRSEEPSEAWIDVHSRSRSTPPSRWHRARQRCRRWCRGAGASCSSSTVRGRSAPLHRHRRHGLRRASVGRVHFQRGGM